MPQVGEIRPAKHIEGFRDSWTKYIWIACPFCGKERWVQYVKGEPINKRCQTCFCKRNIRWGDKNPSWKGGRSKSKFGYILIRLKPDDFFYPMVPQRDNGRRGYVFEHRIVMAKHLGRCLLPWEIIHHKNGIRNDNRIENLKLLSANRYHLPDSLAKAMIRRLQNKVNQQTKEIKKLEQICRQQRDIIKSLTGIIK